MKKILRAALLLAEIIASVWAVDLAFSLISDPSTWLLIAGIWLFFWSGLFGTTVCWSRSIVGRSGWKGRRRCR